VHDDTRRLRRMLAKDRARILFATIGYHGGRWWISLNVEAADLHPAHHARPDDAVSWVGVDRGLSAFLVAATTDGTEVARISDPPKALAAGTKQQRRLSKSLSRKKDHTTAPMPPPSSGGITIVSQMCAAISCTRFPASWLRPTTGSSSRT
jgi:putative transposase